MSKKFNPKKLAKLNNSDRLKAIPPEFIWTRLAMDNCHTIADIGAGTGLFTRAFLSQAGGGKAFAADISSVMVEWMENHLSVDKGEIVPLLMEESSIPLDENSVDLVLMFNLYHELDEPSALLKEAKRILREGGKICISDWKKEKTDHGPAVDHRISSESIQKDLKEYGFSQIRSDNSLKEHSLVWASK